MRMMRLLAAGKSLAGLKNSGARYRMTDPGALPKFGAATNPFHSKSKAEVNAAGAAALGAANDPAPAQAQTVSEPKQDCEQSNSHENKTAPVPSAAPAPPQGRLTRKLRQLFEPRIRPAKSGVPRFAKPVQTELTLDNIRVVRNDLSDTDL